MLQAVELLYALGALDKRSHLTDPEGTRLAEIPLHPIFGKMLLASVDMGCTEEILNIAAMTQIQNVFVNAPNEKHKAVSLQESHTTQTNVSLLQQKLFCFSASKKAKLLVN